MCKWQACVVAIVVLSCSGCEWNSTLYERYVDETVMVCEGVCTEIGEVTEEMCRINGGHWESAVCLEYKITGEGSENLNMPASSEECIDAQGTWYPERCMIDDKDVCTKIGGTWEAYDYRILDLGKGNYIRKIGDGESARFVCGAYSFVIHDDNNTLPCEDADIELFEEALKYRLCPVGRTCQSAYTNDMVSGKSNDKLAICSSCPENNVMCRNRHHEFACVNLDNDNHHCGRCGYVCGKDEVCERGICQKSEITQCAVTDWSCEQGEGVAPKCYDPSSESYCGINSCENTESFACVDGAKCVNNNRDEETNRVYECQCIGLDGKTVFDICDTDGERRCLMPDDNKTCGETCTTPGISCVGNTSCQKIDDVYQCVCTDGRVTLRTDSGIECIDPMSDKRYCGLDEAKILAGESHPCGLNEGCVEGKCECLEGYIKCGTDASGNGGECIRPEIDAMYCGAKGACNDSSQDNDDYKGAVCNSTQECKNGQCVCNATKGLINCGDECIDPLSHPLYCGAKGTCTGADVGLDCTKTDTPVCINGSCAANCPDGQEMCEKTCVNTQTSVKYCGGCKKKDTCETAFANGISQCVEGQCQLLTCKPGFEDCDGDASNGCETNVLSNVENCGVCGNKCADYDTTISSAVCENGRCQVSACYEGRGDCDQLIANGCERDISTDVFNCGACNQECELECYYYEGSWFDEADTEHTARCLAKCEGGKCCATGHLNTRKLSEFTCCAGYELWEYRHIWLICDKENVYGCFKPEEAEGLTSCWHKVSN